jgi:hypothetical protein
MQKQDPQTKQISADFTDYIKGSSGFGVGFKRESGAEPLPLMPVLDHEMVQENSPGPKAFGPGLGHQGTHPERVTDEWCFFQETAFIATVVTFGSTVT